MSRSGFVKSTDKVEFIVGIREARYSQIRLFGVEQRWEGYQIRPWDSKRWGVGWLDVKIILIVVRRHLVGGERRMELSLQRGVVRQERDLNVTDDAYSHRLPSHNRYGHRDTNTHRAWWCQVLLPGED